MKVIEHFKSRLREIAHEDTTFSHLIKFLYGFFSNTYIQPIVSILGTVVIAIYIGCEKYSFSFWLLVIIYCIATLLSAWANQHIKEKIRDTQTFQNALFALSAVLRSWAIVMQKCARELNSINVRLDKKSVERSLNKADFQTAACTVCEKLHDFLTKGTNRDAVYVTVYQRYDEKGKDLCRMIAYSSNHEPTSYERRYSIPPFSKDNLKKIEYHTYIFSEGKKDIIVLPDHQAVQNAFIMHPGCESRESQIAQYICIPISPAKQGVTFLLQVDTNVPGLFGNNYGSIEEFAKNTIYPFAQFLHMIYEEARTTKQLIQ